MNNTMSAEKSFNEFFKIIQKLRADDGCPWDKEQTPLSMRKHLVEEVYETVSAINEGNPAHICEELGDIFLNTAMIAYMFEQQKDFSLSDVFAEVSEKLIRRHPHVFPESQGQKVVQTQATTSEQVLNQWDRIKSDVEGKNDEKSIMHNMPQDYPPLLCAYALQKKAAKKGFDWDNAQGAREKFFEEIGELDEAVDENLISKIEDEAGDVLFAAVNWIRHLGLEPSVALARANEKFKNRFMYVEKLAQKKGIVMSSESLEKLDELWNEAKISLSK